VQELDEGIMKGEVSGDGFEMRKFVMQRDEGKWV